MDSEIKTQGTRKTVLTSTFAEGVAVVLSHGPQLRDPWATHLLQEDGSRIQGSYTHKWDTALTAFINRCKIYGVQPDFQRVAVLTVAETAAALIDTLREGASDWDTVYGHLQAHGNGFPGVWTMAAKMALLGESEFGHHWSEGQIEYIDLLSHVVHEMVAICENAEAPLDESDFRKMWSRGIESLEEATRQRWRDQITSRRRWPDWSAIADAIHNHEAYSTYPAFFGLRRVAMTGNPSGIVHYVDADMVQRMLVSIENGFTEEMERPWGLPIFNEGDPDLDGKFHYLDGPEYWNEDSDVVDTLPC